ncbi:uncharacterized protein [Acropora muricata]|uniref:uncharacterized protein n=1 Tax=Acropora muricata TaxID=159855 RepID=UPI0034E4D655
MTFVEKNVEWSATLTDRLGLEILTVLETKGQVLHRTKKFEDFVVVKTECFVLVVVFVFVLESKAPYYPCLYDKKSADFKDKNKKALAWSDVAKEVGLQNGDEACKLFQYLRNKYSRDKKKIEGKKVSGSSTDEVREAKVEASEIYSFLSWLDLYVQPRKTSSNYVINVDTDNENQEDGDDERPDTPSDMSSSSVKEPSLNSTNIVKPKKRKARNHDLSERLQEAELGQSHWRKLETQGADNTER